MKFANYGRTTLKDIVSGLKGARVQPKNKVMQYFREFGISEHRWARKEDNGIIKCLKQESKVCRVRFSNLVKDDGYVFYRLTC